jgi:hypothetical protein
MRRYYLTVQIKSDATFGRGAGLAGLLDVEIEHDQFGCPFIGGRVLKGLLVEEWTNLRFALSDPPSSSGTKMRSWDNEATWLFGTSGATQAHMHIDAATLPPDLHTSIQRDVESKRLQPHDVLSSLTAIRRQTAMDAETGAPEEASLRAMRVLLRETDLIAPLDFDVAFPADQQSRILGLLSACVLAVRRGGTGRNRGRGKIALLLHESEPANYHDATFTHTCFTAFANEVRQ